MAREPTNKKLLIDEYKAYLVTIRNNMEELEHEINMHQNSMVFLETREEYYLNKIKELENEED